MEHLRECAACSAVWAQQSRMASRLRDAAGEWKRLSAPPRVENRLLAVYRAQNGAYTSRTHGIWAPLMAWSAAAATLVAFAFFLISRHQPLPVRHGGSAVEVASVQADSYDEDSGFIPLPNAAQIAENEDVNIVRVELPRSAMIELGYEVSPDRASEPVEAEVMLGADGLARAVRFMDEE